MRSASARSSSTDSSLSESFTNSSTESGSISRAESSRAIPAHPFPAATLHRTRTSAKRISSTRPQERAREMAELATFSLKPSRTRRWSNCLLACSLIEHNRSILRIAAFSSYASPSDEPSKDAPFSQTPETVLGSVRESSQRRKARIRIAVWLSEEKDPCSISIIFDRSSARILFCSRVPTYFLPFGFAAGVSASASSGVRCGKGILKASRTLASSSSRKSGLSFKVCLAASLPWPSRCSP